MFDLLHRLADKRSFLNFSRGRKSVVGGNRSRDGISHRSWSSSGKRSTSISQRISVSGSIGIRIRKASMEHLSAGDSKAGSENDLKGRGKKIKTNKNLSRSK